MGLYERELRRRTFQSNVILKIDGVYYSQYRPDSGITILEENVGVISTVSINPISVDFRDVKTSFSTLTFTLLDKNGIISTSISNDPYAWQNAEVILYLGFINGSFPFANYRQISVTRIRSFTKSENTYTFKADDAMALIKQRIYTTATELTANFVKGSSTANVTSTAAFASSGIFKIGEEYVSYGGKTGTSFTSCVRAQLSSKDEDHDAGDLAYKVTTVQGKAMDILLDILQNQCGIPASNINTSLFTALRDGPFATDPDLKFYMADIENALTWVEDNILIATNTRLYADNNGLLAVALLDQVVYSDQSKLFSEDYQVGFPTYTVDTSRIVNRVKVYTDYQYGTNKFQRTQVYDDTDSIAKFGVKEMELKLYGVYSSIDLSNLIPPNRATRLLLRLATPKGEINTTTFLSMLDAAIGDQVYFVNRYLPQPGSAIEFNQLMEVTSKAPVNLTNDAKVNWKLIFTSYTGFRVPLISPSPIIETVVSQKKVIINATDAAILKAGYKMQLQDNTTRLVYADAANPITFINGTEITFQNDFSTTLTTDILLTFPDYDNSTEEQRGLFCSISDTGDIFTYDGKSAYLIVV